MSIAITRVASVFDTIYGRLPTEHELALIYEHGNVDDFTPASDLFRGIIGMHERNQYPTPFLVRFGPSDVRYHPIEGVEVAIDGKDHSVSLPIERGIYAPDTVAFLRRVLKPGMTFMDIGANIGFFTALGASLVGPAGRVLAFEPYSENCRLILLTADRNGFKNVELHAVALGREPGSAFFSPALGSNAGFMAQTRDQLMNPQCIVVPVARLDDLAPAHVDVVKIDVEGAEAMIFEASPRLLTETRPIICAEFAAGMTRQTSGVDPEGYLRKIQSYGYEISRMERDTSNEIPVPDVSRFLAEDDAVYGPLHDLVFRPS